MLGQHKEKKRKNRVPQCILLNASSELNINSMQLLLPLSGQRMFSHGSVEEWMSNNVNILYHKMKKSCLLLITNCTLLFKMWKWKQC